MSFDIMRRHRRKVEIPLAIFVVVTFVFLGFGGADLGSFLFGRGRGSGSSGVVDEMALYGRDMSRAGFVGEPRFNDDPNEGKLTDEQRKQRDQQRRLDYHHWYARADAENYLAALSAEEMDVQIGDGEVTTEIESQLPRWGLSAPLDRLKYVKALSGRGLSDSGYRKLIRQLTMASRSRTIFSLAAGASESEQYDLCCFIKQKVRVQYFQRRAEDFVAEVEEASRKEAAAPPPPPVAVPVTSPEPADKDKAKPVRKGVSDEDVRKRYDNERKWIEKRKDLSAGRGTDAALKSLPECFSPERAQVECLLAPKKDFLKGLVVSDMEVEKYYQDNKDREFMEEPKPDAKADEKKAPAAKPLDDKLRGEIRKELLDRKSLEAADARIKAAIAEYDRAEAGHKPPLGELAKKHGLLSFSAGPAEREELETAKFLEGWPALVGVFSEEGRKAMTKTFSAPMRLKADDGTLALRVVSFQPQAILDFDQARAGVRHRLVLEKALELAKAAIDEDFKALNERKLDPKRVRLSEPIAFKTTDELLNGRNAETGQPKGPFEDVDETWGLVTGLSTGAAELSVGEAVAPYPYKKILGEEAAAARKAEKDGKKKDLFAAIADSMARGYRVAILAERQWPTFEEFKDDFMFRFYIWRSCDAPWRESPINGWCNEKFRQLGLRFE